MLSWAAHRLMKTDVHNKHADCFSTTNTSILASFNYSPIQEEQLLVLKEPPGSSQIVFVALPMVLKGKANILINNIFIF